MVAWVTQIVQDNEAGARCRPTTPTPTPWLRHYPNVNLVTEMTDMLAATRSYEANVTVRQRRQADGDEDVGNRKG